MTDKHPFTFHITPPGDICSILPDEGIQDDGLIVVDWPLDHADSPKRVCVTMREVVEKGCDNTGLGVLPESLKMQLAKTLIDCFQLITSPDPDETAAKLGYRRDDHAVH